MALMSISFSDRDALTARPQSRRHLPPLSLRVLLFIAAIATTGLAYWFTRNQAASHSVANAGADLTRVLRFMVLLKGMLAIGMLGLVSLRFRFAIAPGLAFAYTAGSAVMAAGPGVMWNMADIGLGALLFYAGLAALFVLARIDEGARWRFGRHHA